MKLIEYKQALSLKTACHLNFFDKKDLNDFEKKSCFNYFFQN